MNFGMRLAGLIKEKGIQKQQFANMFYLTKQAVSGYISGRRTPSDELKEKFADFFNVSIDYLMARTDIRIPIINTNKINSDEINIEKLKKILDSSLIG